MGWEHGLYYTRSKRVDGLVKREYVGIGLVGEVAAELDAQKRDQRKVQAGVLKDKKTDLSVDVFRAFLMCQVPPALREKLDLPPCEWISQVQMIDALIVMTYHTFFDFAKLPRGSGEDNALLCVEVFARLVKLKHKILAPFRLSGKPEDVKSFLEDLRKKIRPNASHSVDPNGPERQEKG